MTISRSNAVLVIVVIVSIAVASVVAVHGHSGEANAANPAAVGLADTSTSTSTFAASTGSSLEAPDPAQQVPNLDQFTSRNPFIQVTAAPAPSPTPTVTPTSTPSPSPSPSPSPTPVKPLVAKIHIRMRINSKSVNETFSDRGRYDRLPPSAPVFEIKGIFSDRVKFELINGYRLVRDRNEKTFEVHSSALSTPRSIEKGSLKTVCNITVLQIGKSRTSSASSSDNAPLRYAASHSIEALSIETQNGVPSVTLEVDGATLSAVQLDGVLTTAWGQIEILDINSPAQTVTIQHADLQETLHVGQSVPQ